MPDSKADGICRHTHTCSDVPLSTLFIQHGVLICRPQHAVTISSPTTGITLEVDTTSPGLQFYSGGLLSVDTPVTGKAGVDYPQFGGFAVETQVQKIGCTCNKCDDMPCLL